MKSSIKKTLENLLGPSRVAVDPVNRALYCRDMMSGSTLEMKAGLHPHLPDLICWPETTEEVSKIVRTANHHKIPVIPFGGGSGVSGGTLPLRGGIMIDLKRMASLETIKRVDDPYPHYVATIQSGILGEHLERKLNERGYTLGHFPSSILCATLGGYLAARSAGQLSSRYGKIEEMVEDLEAVLPLGTIVPFGGRIKKYPEVAPKEILVGSEGTLGIITRARMRIHPMAPAARYRGISFNSLSSALRAIRNIMQTGLRPSVIRLYDELDSLLLKYGYEADDRKKTGKKFLSEFPYLSSLKENAFHALLHHPDWIQTLFQLAPAECLLIIGFEGDADFIRHQEKEALKICKERIARDLGEKPGLHWLKKRYSVSFKMPDLLEKDCFVDTIEVAATWDRLEALYEGVRRELKKQCLVLAHFSHAYSEGCSIYFTVIGHTGSARKNLESYRQVWRKAMGATLAAGGTISHHHGIGLLKAEWLAQELGGAMRFFKRIKSRNDGVREKRKKSFSTRSL
ncbi:MAG: FAD-binding oxidoreductase [Deltaproteobacteria bacterium]|nr:FAD-binding oxidoreductase [Deltaproteobacteria bacterium]